MSLQQRKLKFKPRMKLNNNIYTYINKLCYFSFKLLITNNKCVVPGNIHTPSKDGIFLGMPPPFGKFQVNFILFFKNLGLSNPPPLNIQYLIYLTVNE